ncbi:MAG: DUF4214 domain-containing protein [Candidatus Competibacteraceae bacterium]|nr:DUF4214 domain-containing protein [Candidatus Competibacteraceae bacterium]
MNVRSVRGRSRRVLGYWGAISTVAVLFGAPLSYAATFTVANLSDSGLGSLRQAVSDANNTVGADTIVFQAGLSGTLSTSGGFVINDPLTIIGAAPNVTISGNNAQRIFTINSGKTVFLSTIKLQNGGINNAGTLFLQNSTIQSSKWSGTDGGGAISNSLSSSVLTVSYCVLEGNSTPDGLGGGIFNRGKLTVNNTVLSANAATTRSGGAVYNLGALTVNNSTFTGNLAGRYGGGLKNDDTAATMTITNTTINANTAQGGGGGINNENGVLTLYNSTISGNGALSAVITDGGGGLRIRAGTTIVLNSTIVNNTAPSSRGGGVFNASLDFSAGNSVIAGNSAATGASVYNSSGVFKSRGRNVFGENGVSGLSNANTAVGDIVIPGAIGTAIGPLANNGGPTLTQLPVAGGSLIDAGDNALAQSAALGADQRGYRPRIVNAAVDIGAVEIGALPAEQTLIGHYYQSILNRAPDPSGWAYWQGEVSRLQGLGVDVQEAFRVMAGWFFYSAEYLARNTNDSQYVTDLYRTFFQRDPDSGGLNYWIGQLTQGMPRPVVLFSFLFSTEFGSYMQGLLGSTASRAEVYAVVDFYRGFLNRLSDTSGFTYWAARFRAAQCQGAAAVNNEVNSISTQFLGSGEYLNRSRGNRDYVADLYYAFLRRGGDLEGFNYWVGQLDGGLKSREQLRGEFLGSAEFQNRVAQIISQGCL